MDQTRAKVVLVDDNIATLNQGKNLLKAFYKVYTVQSAITLFENLENDIPDLILLDIEMPDMNGFETIKKLKADVRYKDIPVIFLTSRSDDESERKGFYLGAVDFITKPFTGPLLHKRISNQLLYARVQTAMKDYANKRFLDAATHLATDIEEALVKFGEAKKTIRDKPDEALLTKLLNACESYDIDEIDTAMAEIESYEYTSDEGFVAWLRENLDQGKSKNIKERLSSFLGSVDRI